MVSNKVVRKAYANIIWEIWNFLRQAIYFLQSIICFISSNSDDFGYCIFYSFLRSEKSGKETRKLLMETSFLFISFCPN